jgi:hypothetical protein
VEAIFRWRRLHRPAAKSDKKKCSAGAPGDEEENRRRGRGAGSLVLSQSTKLGDDACRLWRKILGSLGAVWWNWKRGKVEGVVGYL